MYSNSLQNYQKHQKKNKQIVFTYMHNSPLLSMYIYTPCLDSCVNKVHRLFRTEQSLHEKYLVCSTQIGNIAITCDGYITSFEVVHIIGCFWSWIYFDLYSGFVNTLLTQSLHQKKDLPFRQVFTCYRQCFKLLISIS